MQEQVKTLIAKYTGLHTTLEFLIVEGTKLNEPIGTFQAQIEIVADVLKDLEKLQLPAVAIVPDSLPAFSNDAEPRLTFEQFVATKQKVEIADYCNQYGMSRDEFDYGKYLLVYQGGLYIEVLPSEKVYFMQVERDEYFTAELPLLEKRLYEFGAGNYFEVPENEQ